MIKFAEGMSAERGSFGRALARGVKHVTLKKRQAKKCTLVTATTRSRDILNIDAPRYTTA
jgi:hypothetical protein